MTNNVPSIGLAISVLEKRSLDELWQQYPSLPRQLIADLTTLFINSRSIGARIIKSIHGDIFHGQLILAQITRRTNELLLGGVQQIAYGNRYLTAATFRGVIETFGAIAWVTEQPARLPNLVNQKGVRVGKLINVAYTRSPGLKTDYERLSNWLHPRTDSFYSGLITGDPIDHEIYLSVQLEPFLPAEAIATMGAIAEGVHMIQCDVQGLVDLYPEVLTSGKVFAKSQR